MDIQKQKTKGGAFPYTKTNGVLFGLAVLFLILGYFALSRGPWNSFMSLTLAPILLVIGYCVLFPLAILYRKKEKS